MVPATDRVGGTVELFPRQCAMLTFCLAKLATEMVIKLIHALENSIPGFCTSQCNDDKGVVTSCGRLCQDGGEN